MFSPYLAMCISQYCYALAIAVINMHYGPMAAIQFLTVLGVFQ